MSDGMRIAAALFEVRTLFYISRQGFEAFRFPVQREESLSHHGEIAQRDDQYPVPDAHPEIQRGECFFGGEHTFLRRAQLLKEGVQRFARDTKTAEIHLSNISAGYFQSVLFPGGGHGLEKALQLLRVLTGFSQDQTGIIEDDVGIVGRDQGGDHRSVKKSGIVREPDTKFLLQRGDDLAVEFGQTVLPERRKFFGFDHLSPGGRLENAQGIFHAVHRQIAIRIRGQIFRGKFRAAGFRLRNADTEREDQNE